MQNFGDETNRKSYLPDLNDYPDSDLEDEKDRGPDEEIQGWDVFKHFPTRIKTGSKADTKFFDRAAQVTKFVSYFVLFAVMLVCGIIAKATIILAVSQIDDKGPVDYCDYNDIAKEPTHRKVSATVSPQYHLGWYWCVIGAFSFPEILGIVRATHHWLFKKRNIPRKVDLAVQFTIDTLHAVGLALLFLFVLPEMNSIQAVVVSSCTCFVPGLLGIFSRNLRQHSQGKALALLIGDIVAFAFQFCGAFVWLYPDSRVPLTIQARSILPVALVLTSCRWWGNYVSAYSSFGFIRFLFRVKKRLEIGKGLAHGFSAVWRIVVFLATSVLIAYSKGIEPRSFFDSNILIGKYNVSLYDGLRVASTSKMASRIIDDVSASGNLGYFTVDSYLLPLVVLVVHLASAFLTYSSGIFAYKTMMQDYGFALPVTLTVPATVGAVILATASRNADTCFFHRIIPDYVFFAEPENFGTLLDFFCQWYPWIWLVTLLSQAWITMHIWLPHSERLAATEHIFLTPTYDSLIIAQSIVLNRQVDEIPGDCHVPETLGIAEESGNAIYSNCSSKSGLSELELSDRVTRIIVCATMWHETEDEMTEFVGSILRLDMDQGSKRFTQGYYNLRMQDYYELETHVFFDDAFRCMHACEGRCEHNENETQVNDYVMTLVSTMQKSVERLNIFARPPTKYPTPYGGRLEWNLPGQTRMIVHLKDKNKIRHRKRWSQVMYMYYLLGHLLMDTAISQDRKEVIAENTYLLTLDGDIDFRPSAVKVLVDLMKRNRDLGAACGRIHPIGTGPMVWFQKFEYAIGHWLQKSTEHTIGSVLCSPGAFSLFRAKALMEHNVMRKYATQSTEAMHYVQYDQGEDRWLCTLILQVGYRVEYSAASDSYTHAPETFNEFYNQRRRWIPSTIANIFDLLGTSQETRRVNNDISWLYIVYQWVLMGSTVLGPGTIFLMLVGAFVAAFRIGNWISLGYNLIPIVIFIAVCVACSARIQLIVASVISALYGLVMIIVLVGIMLQIAEDGWVAPSTILFFVVAGQLIIAALLHPQEWGCLCCGIIYYVTVPSMYMLLIIFALFNVNNVTWGTRDSKAPGVQGSGKTENQARNEKATIGDRFRNASGKSRGAIEFSLAGLFKCMLCTQDDDSSEDANGKIDAISESLDRISTRLETIERNSDRNDAPLNCRGDVFVSNRSGETPRPIIGRNVTTTDSELYTDDYTDGQGDTASESDIYDDGSTFGSSNFLISPYWLQDERLRKGGVEFLSREEEYFWESLIEKYLQPIEEDKKKLAKIAEALKDLRNEYVFKFFMLNALFVLIIFLMQLNKDVLHLEWPLGQTYNITYVSDRQEVLIAKNYLKLEPIGCVFILGFVIILGVQFIAMLFHRFNTFSHILANTSIEWPWCKKPTDPNNEADLEKHAEDIVDGLHKVIENNAGSSVARRNSTIAPGKRKTVRDLIDSQDRRVRLPTSLDNLFRRNLNDSRSEISRFMSTRLPPGVVEAFERRHSSMVASQRPTQGCNNVNGYRGVNNVAGTKLGENSIAGEDSYNYDNKAFVPDSYDENPTDSEATLSHRTSQMSFQSDDQ